MSLFSVKMHTYVGGVGQKGMFGVGQGAEQGYKTGQLVQSMGWDQHGVKFASLGQGPLSKKKGV
jgi:hypothetical protein